MDIRRYNRYNIDNYIALVPYNLYQATLESHKFDKIGFYIELDDDYYNEDTDSEYPEEWKDLIKISRMSVFIEECKSEAKLIIHVCINGNGCISSIEEKIKELNDIKQEKEIQKTMLEILVSNDNLFYDTISQLADKKESLLNFWEEFKEEIDKGTPW